MNIALLEGYTTNPGDLNWDPLREFGSLTIYDRTSPEELIVRSKHAEIIICNKIKFTPAIFKSLPKLRMISVLATGVNNIDLKEAKKQGIIVCNATGYGEESVAQHAFALILALIHKIKDYDGSVLSGDWGRSQDFCFYLSNRFNLKNKTLGIYGYGKIGSKLAEIAINFGMKVIAFRRSPLPNETLAEMVNLETLWAKSDIISLHASLSDDNMGIINKETLDKMKPNAILINTGRGGLINEIDLRAALDQGRILGAGLDVLSEEPPINGNALISAPNCIITPHIAWAAVEARQALIQITAQNIKTFLQGNAQNRVV